MTADGFELLARAHDHLIAAVRDVLGGVGAFLIPVVRDGFGTLAAAVPVADGAGAADRLPAFSGRDPRWTPAAG
ncbi:hypothetical protein ACFVSN_36410 [Kitasatospora sp. NPDC057904]|uniref:hypothetical protein n=1 Tax=Kitasatospora sp. NPDC057904 TaxID=3346275 RepID=UPI0036D79BFC